MTQPLLPAPIDLTDAEKSYIQESPPGLWPENQDSNFGARRKAFCDVVTDIFDKLQLLYSERFVDSTSNYINQWEEQMGIPVALAGRSLEQRRAVLKSRLRRGAFTNLLRKQTIEDAIIATFGVPASFSPAGISLSGGIPLHGDVVSPSQYYRIIENVTGFSYQVLIDYRIGYDVASLTRELTRITPAGIVFTLLTWYPKIGGGKSVGVAGGTHA